MILLLLAIYSLEWIGLISWDVLHHDHSGYYGTETWQLVVFFPLSLAGWVQVYSTVCAIPFRQGLLKTERKAIYRTRMSRFLESAILRNVLLVANPCIYLVVLLVTCIPAGHYQVSARDIPP